ncbi:MAG: immunoglobulin domain-containing protein [Bacteroidota bacterium]
MALLYKLNSLGLVACIVACLTLSSPAMTWGGEDRAGGSPQVGESVITLWDGNVQHFGEIGNPVPDINILGNVSPSKNLSSLTYTLNGGVQVTLTVGPDDRRLERQGDFNIDIPLKDLFIGTNQIIITANDDGGAVRETVIVHYTAGQSWPLPYNVNWSSVGTIGDAAQVVDGFWEIQSGFLHPVQPGYDRFVAIGDQQWSDYEVTVPVTILGLDSSGFAPPSNGCGVGFLMRWPGHSDLPASLAGRQPKTGYLPLGALGWHEWEPTGQRTKLLGNNLQVLDQDSTGRTLLFNTPYLFKMRVETTPGSGGRYMMKIWEASDPEPVEWDLVGQEAPSDPQQGSLLLVAHHTDVLFGDVSVVPAKTTIPSTIVSDDFSDSILNTTLWTVANPLADASFSLTGSNTPDAWMNISVPAGTVHDPWTAGNNSPRLIQAANNTDFEVEAKFESAVSQRFQLQGIVAQESNNSFLRFEFHSDGTSTRMFIASLVNGVPTTRLNAVLGPNGIAPLFMRVRRVGNGWLMKYSLDGVSWTIAASFTHVMNLTGVGPYGGNAGTTPPSFASQIDYFFNVASPIIPEDSVQADGPTIVQQPASTTVNVGQAASFTVSATGTDPLAYQWQKNGVSVPGAILPSYTTPPTVPADNGAEFRCVVSNVAGSITSAVAILTVIGPPTITQHPAGDTVTVGQTATFSVVAVGSGTLSYQWQRNGSAIAGATSSVYTTPPVATSDNGALFRCIVTNSAGAATSSQAMLTVISPPVITQHPSGDTVIVGQSASFAVAATGTAPLSYQWEKNSADIVGATSSSYTTPPATLGDNGARFRCRVSNAAGSTTSTEAVLVVTAGDDNRITEGLLALYTFHEGAGSIVTDVSNVIPQLHLSIVHPSRVTWHDGYLSVNEKTVIRSALPALKVILGGMLANALSVEAWIRPANDDDDDDDDLVDAGEDDEDKIARIVSNASKQTMKLRNFSLESSDGRYIGRLRTTQTDNQIQPNVTSPDEVVDDALTHLVYTRSQEGVAKLYINGDLVKTENVEGTLTNWDVTYPLSIANEVSLNRPWYGDIHLVALYGRSLSASEALQNYSAGPDPEIAGPVKMSPIQQEKTGMGTLLPVADGLHQNYPNPFNPATKITFSIPTGAYTSLRVYDVLGREVAAPVNEYLVAGTYQIPFDASHLASGVYLYRLQSGNLVQSRRMILQR